MANQNKKTSLYVLAESAIMVALATVLSMVKVYEAPYGGSVTLLSMAPIIILSMRRGVKTGLLAGFVYSLIQLLLGLNNVAWVPTPMGIVLCCLLDYILPFTLLVTLLRFACHIVSGAVIWYALDLEWYADDPTHIVHKYGAWMFSVIYNGTFMLPEIVETVIGVPLLTKALSKVNMKH